MIKSKRLRLFSKILSILLLILVVLASYRGHRLIVSAFKDMVIETQLSYQELNNIYIVLINLLGGIMMISGAVTFLMKGRFIFKNWIATILVIIFAFVESIGIYVYYLEQTGFYKNLIIPIIPLAYLIILASIGIYDILHDEGGEDELNIH